MPGKLITVSDHASSGSFTPVELARLVWSLRYQALYQYNRSPWVERGYADAVLDVRLIAPSAAPPAGAYHLELLDVSDDPGALGYHEDEAAKAGAHSSRGLAAGTETPLAKVFCTTSREDGVAPSEVASHELLEMIVDPLVMNDSQLRVYPNPATGQEYIGEVGDPVQSRGYDVGATEKRPCGFPEAIVADFAYPGWWKVAQTRPFTSAAEEFALAPAVAAFELAPGGYMSVRDPGGEWSQIYGSDRKKAEANAHAFAGPDDGDVQPGR